MPKSPLLLAIDVGNSATTCGLYRSYDTRFPVSPLAVWNLSTRRLQAAGSFSKFLRSHFRQNRMPLSDVEGVIISSVVPSIDATLRKETVSLFGVKPHFVSVRTPSIVKVLYRNPREVGADRLVNARAAVEGHTGPSIVIDFGTATTFDCISSDKEYLGGVIAPGPVISAEALYQRTAKLPYVVLNKPARILGRNTEESIQSGLYNGYRGLVKEIVVQLKSVMGSRTKVLATGGQARWILKGLSLVDKYDPHLTLLGLYCLWKDISRGS